jgi:hypothetical protein
MNSGCPINLPQNGAITTLDDRRCSRVITLGRTIGFPPLHQLASPRPCRLPHREQMLTGSLLLTL